MEKDGFPIGSTGVVVGFYSTGPACEVEMWDENFDPVDVVTFRLDELERPAEEIHGFFLKSRQAV